VIDVSKGIGADLSHYAQANSGHDGVEPQSHSAAWGGWRSMAGDQVAGRRLSERCDIPSDSDDEQTFWREYLLFNRQEGFVFLGDSEDGWSWVKPLTGAPQVRGEVATWNNKTYRQRERYEAKVTWVLGEFTGVRRRRAAVTDFTARDRQQPAAVARASGNEVTWSEGPR
jgi:hypothetical protein